MSAVEANLRAAIEGSYVAFASMPPPQTLHTSPLRDGAKILQTLTSASLRQLEDDQVGPYAGWAITTVGDERDYRHFLPRIFELAVTDPTWLGAYPQVIAGKLNMAKWRTWPAEQQAAVLHVFYAAFQAAAERHPHDGQSADEWFCGIVLLGEPASSTMARWHSVASPNAALHIASFIIGEAKHLSHHTDVRGSFWSDVDEGVRREVAKLLIAERTKQFLRAAVSRVAEEDRFYFLNPALAELQQVRCI